MTNANTVADFLKQLNIDEVAYMNRNFKKSVANGWIDEFIAKPGRKNIKIVKSGEAWGGQCSAKFFIKPDGTILKAASWKAPSKTIVGKILNM